MLLVHFVNKFCFILGIQEERSFDFLLDHRDRFVALFDLVIVDQREPLGQRLGSETEPVVGIRDLIKFVLKLFIDISLVFVRNMDVIQILP